MQRQYISYKVQTRKFSNEPQTVCGKLANHLDTASTLARGKYNAKNMINVTNGNFFQTTIHISCTPFPFPFPFP